MEGQQWLEEGNHRKSANSLRKILDLELLKTNNVLMRKIVCEMYALSHLLSFFGSFKTFKPKSFLCAIKLRWS